jgi:hypothetical protein
MEPGNVGRDHSLRLAFLFVQHKDVAYFENDGRFRACHSIRSQLGLH